MIDKNRKIRDWRRLALPASIVLNLFLVALIGGHLWQSRSEGGYSGSPLTRALARAEASLPPKDAAAFGAAIRRDAPQYAQAAQQLTEARQEFWRQVTADQFNQHDTRQALDAWRTAWNRFLDAFSNTIVTALAEISPEGRRKFVAERREQLSRPLIEVPAPK